MEKLIRKYLKKAAGRLSLAMEAAEKGINVLAGCGV